jgi:hypothetical protein
MNNVLYYCLIAGLLCMSNAHPARAQSGNSHPDKLPWVDGVFPPKRGDFEYRVARGEGATLSDARSDAFNGLLEDLGNKAGVTVNSQTLAEIRSNLNYEAGSENYQESSASVTTHRIDREGFKASFTKVSEYYEYVRGRYLLWELYEVSSGKEFKAIIPEYTTRYGASALWRSIVPGWGQFYKGKTGKGIMFLASEALLVTAAVYCEVQRSDNFRKSQESTNMTIVKEYRNRTDSWELNRNIVIGTAAGVYVWNLLDAALARGKLKYAWIPQNMNLLTTESNDTHLYGIAFKF